MRVTVRIAMTVTIRVTIRVTRRITIQVTTRATIRVRRKVFWVYERGGHVSRAFRLTFVASVREKALPTRILALPAPCNRLAGRVSVRL